MKLYFDYATAFPSSPRAVAAIQPFLQGFWANPWAPHRKGQDVAQQLNFLYQKMRQLLLIRDTDRTVITSSSAEAISQVLFSVYRDVTMKTGKNHFLYPATAEASILKGIKGLESFGCIGKTIPVHSTGYITTDRLIEAISPRTALVALSMANGLTGVKQPLEEVVAICRQRGILVYTETTPIFGKQTWELPPTDFWSLDGRVLGNPLGGGLLVAAQHVPLAPLIFGGQEPLQIRGGAPSLSIIAGLIAALEDALDGVDWILTETARIKAQFEENLLNTIPGAAVCLGEEERIPNCTGILFPGVVGEALYFLLQRKGIAVSMGGGGFQQLSLLLQACGIETQRAQSALSFSFSKESREEDVRVLEEEVVAAYYHLRRIGGGDG